MRPSILRIPIVLFAAGLTIVATPHVSSAVDLVINEFQAINTTTAADEFGEFDDWVEIHNFGATPVNVEGLFLTDDFTNLSKFELPDTVITPGGYLVIWCDGDLAQGPLHANINLDGDGEEIGLFDTLFKGQAPIDTLSFGPQMVDVSYGRFPNGSGPFTFLGAPSIGAENNEPFNLPPLLVGTGHAPPTPTDTESVFITVQVVEDFGIAEVLAYVDTGGGFVSTPMADDGTQGDGAAGDGIWGATVPPQPDGPVSYYVSAEDDFGLVVFDPADAPTTTYTYIVGYEPPALFINEFLASNTSVNSDEQGEFDDWIEIYNGSGEDVSLLGMHLSDNLLEPNRFVFPDITLPASGYLLVWCDNDVEQGPLHAPFRLAAGGEEIGLFDAESRGTILLDSYTFGPQQPDVSEGRRPDGGDTWEFFTTPTPEASNDPNSGIESSEHASLRLRVLGNPSLTTTRFALDLATESVVRLSVFTVTGREIARLVDQTIPAGSSEWAWDGQRTDGTRHASGVFLYRLSVGDETQSGTFVRLE